MSNALSGELCLREDVLQGEKAGLKVNAIKEFLSVSVF